MVGCFVGVTVLIFGSGLFGLRVGLQTAEVNQFGTLQRCVIRLSGISSELMININILAS